MKTALKKSGYWISVVIIGVVLGLSIQFVAAWTEPAQKPPAGNLEAPINTSNIGQLKQGNLVLNTNGTWANGLIVANGNVGIGTTNPTQKLDVAGNARATDFCTTGGKCLSNALTKMTRIDNSSSSAVNLCSNPVSAVDIAVQCPSGSFLVDCGVKNSDNNRRWTDGSFYYGGDGYNNHPFYWMIERGMANDPDNFRNCHFRMAGGDRTSYPEQCTQSWTLSAYCLEL